MALVTGFLLVFAGFVVGGFGAWGAALCFNRGEYPIAIFLFSAALYFYVRFLQTAFEVVDPTKGSVK